jgi:hypothetical protein
MFKNTDVCLEYKPVRPNDGIFIYLKKRVFGMITEEGGTS